MTVKLVLLKQLSDHLISEIIILLKEKRETNIKLKRLGTYPALSLNWMCQYEFNCQRECGEKGTLLYCWWECKLIQPLRKIVSDQIRSDESLSRV